MTNAEHVIETIVDDWLDRHCRLLRGGKPAKELTTSLYANVKQYKDVDGPPDYKAVQAEVDGV